MSKRSITIYHSPDSDDAFMFYALAKGKIEHPEFDFKHALSDIETLNHMALRGEAEVTAVSVHAFSYLKNRYAILTCGASMGGKNYGPCLVARESFSFQDKKHRVYAIPGRYTSAALAFQIFLHEEGLKPELVIMPFDRIEQAVLNDEVDAGVIIHEGQLTHEKLGLNMILDLGKWWWSKTLLPLPLGINIVRRDLGEDAKQAIADILKRSIEYSLEHRSEALDYALEFGRGITKGEADTFVGMYVNERTQDLGEIGMKSIKRFLGKGVEYGIIPNMVDIEFVTPN